MTPDSNNTRLIKFPTEEEIADEVAKRYPENLSSLSIEEEGFIKGIRWLSTRLEPEAVQPANELTPDAKEELKTLLTEVLGGVNYVYRFELYNRIISQFDLSRKGQPDELAALRKETLNLKMTIIGLEDSAMASRQERDTLKAELAKVNKTAIYWQERFQNQCELGDVSDTTVIKARINEFNSTIEAIENRAMTHAWVTPTCQEMTEQELSKIWQLLQDIKKDL